MRDTLKISLLGDVLCDNSIRLEKYFNGNNYDFDSILSSCKDLFKDSDYVIGNLETPISKQHDNLTSKMYEFNTPFEFAFSLKKIGVNFLTTANNHCLDRDIDGLKQTLECLDELNIAHTGTFKSSKTNSPFYIKIKNINIGILSYTYGTNAFANKHYLGIKNRKMVNLTQEQERWFERYKLLKRLLRHHRKSFFYRTYRKIEHLFSFRKKHTKEYERNTLGFYRKRLLKSDIKKIKKKSDICIFYLHIGGQYNLEPTNYTKKMVEYLLKLGVNIVIGNHEHVVHKTKILSNNSKFATYAIGNFLSGAGSDYAPFDMYAEYGVVVHLFIDVNDKHIDQITFSIVKSVKISDGCYKVVPAYNEDNDSEEINRILNVAFNFSGKRYQSIEKEFVLVAK